LEQLLKKYSSHFSDISSLYDYQTEVLEKLCKQKNTLAVIPTGGGKSLLYQLMALELEGITLVISPLLALMEEQVDELNIKRKISALALNSKIPFNEQREILRNLKQDSYKLIYISPERLQNPFFRATLISSKINISMIVIDEAHCISQWGSGFRPDYGQINGFVKFLKQNNQNPFLLCLTATLSQLARNDIASEFEIDNDNVYLSSSIIRKNLKLHFQKVENEEEKTEYLNLFLEKYKPNKAIVYLYSKYECENYADEFSGNYSTDYYHADVESEEKTEVYNKFVNGEIDILFATTAFGMGINIPDIESVIHLHIPNSVEEYYQHVGRGWRKKTEVKDCNCLALWSDVNFDRRKKEIENQKYNLEYLNEAFKTLTGAAKIKAIGQVVNKDKDALIHSEYNLQLLKYKLERNNILRTIGEINGSPLTIQLATNTELWNKITEAARIGMDSFGFVCKTLGISLSDVINHLYEEDLKGNIKKLPATKKDIYFELLVTELDASIAEKIVSEINAEIEFRVSQLDELKELFSSEDFEEKLKSTLN
jgi:ATP-dependent DNA helicase RecQ